MQLRESDTQLKYIQTINEKLERIGQVGTNGENSINNMNSQWNVIKTLIISAPEHSNEIRATIKIMISLTKIHWNHNGFFTFLWKPFLFPYEYNKFTYLSI